MAGYIWLVTNDKFIVHVECHIFAFTPSVALKVFLQAIISDLEESPVWEVNTSLHFFLESWQTHLFYETHLIFGFDCFFHCAVWCKTLWMKVTLDFLQNRSNISDKLFMFCTCTSNSTDTLRECGHKYILYIILTLMYSLILKVTLCHFIFCLCCMKVEVNKFKWL